MCRSGRSQGFPHSEIAGSKPIRGSPTLIAAYHVLHRLSVPRHPPNALKSLDHSHYQCSSGVSGLGRPDGRNTDGHSKDFYSSSFLIVLRFACQDMVSHIKSCSMQACKQIPSFTMSISFYARLFSGETGTTGRPGISWFVHNGGLAGWWRQTGSNRRPEACKATALPTELCPQLDQPPHGQTSKAYPIMVGLGGLEPPTSRLSSARSNQLSYRPESQPLHYAT
jgi:hypothetical protein